MDAARGSNVIVEWPDESKEAAQLVLDTYGEPDEATPSQLVWHQRGHWKRIIATRQFWAHDFPAPHHDSVETVIDYRVPPQCCSDLASFDGSVVVERTAGEVSARCHDEQANNLALNLMHDIVIGAKTVAGARDYYAHEFLAARRGHPTPYMDGLDLTPDPDSPDPDERVLSDADLEEAVAEGERRGKG